MNLAFVWCFLHMIRVIFLLCLALDLAGTATAAVHAHGNETDRLALLEFKAKITEDPFGTLSSWNYSIHFCQWRGVICGRRHHQRVTALNLNSQKLTEYGMGNEVSTFGDMYSYDILLLEMFTGKRPTDNMFSDGLNLHNFAKMAWPEQVVRIADPNLLRQLRQEGEASSSNKKIQNQNQSHAIASSEKIEECLISVIRVGVACSEELPRDRTDIKDVVSQLHAIRNNFIGIGERGRRARIATPT